MTNYGRTPLPVEEAVRIAFEEDSGLAGTGGEGNGARATATPPSPAEPPRFDGAIFLRVPA